MLSVTEVPHVAYRLSYTRSAGFSLKHAFAGIVLYAVLPAPFVVAKDLNVGCVATHYNVIRIPMRPASISDSGLVAGTSKNRRAAVWTARAGLREIPVPTGFDNSEATAVNRLGHVVGVASNGEFTKSRAFVFAGGTLTLLAGQQSRANSISESGEIVGESLVEGSKSTMPVRWTNSLLLRPLGGCCGGSAKGINKRGDEAGDVYDERGRYHAFVWTEARGIAPIGPPDVYSASVAINDLGHIVVQASDVFLYAAETLSRLDLSHQFPNRARAINNCDMVVGSYGPYSDAARAFVWDRTRGFRDLNSLIAADSGWTLEVATSINDRGEIVGHGDVNREDDTGFLLVPSS
jgi:probable HAF family extracellular repeat protein